MTNVDKIQDLAKQMLGGTLVTKQTGAAGGCFCLVALCYHCAVVLSDEALYEQVCSALPSSSGINTAGCIVSSLHSWAPQGTKPFVIDVCSWVVKLAFWSAL